MDTNIRMDFSKRELVNLNEQEWVRSPVDGVFRIPLERDAAESGHATSLVKYLPGASFPHHQHPGGEEILVLDGVFSDEKGDYGPGTYLRNPAGSSHAPFSKEGCTIFVRLNQFQSGDSDKLRIDTLKEPWQSGYGNLKVMPLHQFATESVALVKWPQNERFIPHTHFGGEEIFVISGTFIDEHGEYPERTWTRSPHLSNHSPWVKEETLIMVRTGHI